METVVGVEGNDEGKFEESGVHALSSAKQIGNPVVYKLVRVEGDGRLVPATDDEIMEVKDLLEENKSEMHIVTDTGQTIGCGNEGLSSGMPQLESSEGLSLCENTEADAEKLNARLEYIEEMLQKVKQEERLHLAHGSLDHSSAYVNVDGQYSDQLGNLPGIDKKLQSEISLQESVPSLVPSLNCSHTNQLVGVVECLNPPNGPREGGSSTSAVCTSSKPDFSKLKGEICLDSLSIRELHEMFKATFGRETTVKDKQWLKRRIAMGLTNSCDVSTTSFVIKDNKLVKKGEEESCNNINSTFADDPGNATGHVDFKNSLSGPSNQMEDRQSISGKRLGNHGIDHHYGSVDLHKEERATKRVRKPTRRYIEELSAAELRDHVGKSAISAKNLGFGLLMPKSHVRAVRTISSDGRTVVTRLDSLGGSGIQVPCVSRIRRSRPRKNVMALMKFNPSYMGTELKLEGNGHDLHASLSNSENGDRSLNVKSASEQIQQPFVAECEKSKQCSLMGTVEVGRNMGLNHADSPGDTSDDNIVTVPTAKGGFRRKHHRAWTLSEVMRLIEGVSRYGAGRWSQIKRLAFASYSYRTSVDLKDKWRNLLKASFAQTPPDKGANSRKQASIPIPASILVRVRELAEVQGQYPPNVGSSKEGGVGGRSVHDTRFGYL